jgi:serpin B
MAYAGARGETEKQMARALHLNLKQEEVHAGFGELQRRLNDAKRQTEIELNVANGLWAQQGHKFLPDFLNVAKAISSGTQAGGLQNASGCGCK